MLKASVKRRISVRQWGPQGLMKKGAVKLG